MAQRDIKRLFIIIVYFFLFLLITTAIYFKFKQDPSCNDGKQNQGEFGVDCGGPCVPCPEITQLEPLQIDSVEWVHDVDNRYDVVAKVTNPNDVFGASKVSYRANVVDSNSNILGQSRWRSGFVLPGETKYLFVQAFETDALPVDNISGKVEVEIDQENVVWERFRNFEEPNLIINNSRFEQSSGGDVGFGKALGTVINKSAVDFEIVKVKVVLRDDFGNVLATNFQIMNTIHAGEVRDYIIVFPHQFIGSVADVEVEPESSPFDSENYIRVHGSPEVWNEN